jgi:hypothetical protein
MHTNKQNIETFGANRRYHNLVEKNNSSKLGN